MGSSNGEQRDPDVAEVRAILHSMMAELGPKGIDDAIIERALRAAAEMEAAPAFQQVTAALFDPARVRQRPDWGVHLSHAQLKTPHAVYGPKRITDPAGSAPAVLGFCVAYGVLTSPLLRAVLLLHGYQIGFVEAEPKKPASKIITRA